MNNILAFASFHSQQTDEVFDWPCSLSMRADDVMNGFFLYSLLLDKAEQSSVLVLPHDEIGQKYRLQPALEDRNKAMEGIGQESYAHACDTCLIVKEGEDGQKCKFQVVNHGLQLAYCCPDKLHAAVCDGITIGHPCCAVHDCKVPLASHHHRFCPEHSSLNTICAVQTCDHPRSPGQRTCNDPAHRKLERAYFSQGQAIFQLRSKLKKAGVAVPVDSVPLEEHATGHGQGDDEVVIEEEQEECDTKSPEGNRKEKQKLKAYFGRRRTHNDQLILRTCGIIISRATFYGSEAISSVAVRIYFHSVLVSDNAQYRIQQFMRATFPSKDSTPEMFVLDNGCSLDKHLRAIGDSHFSDTARPVDVFHFKSKHKESDTHCQLNCNPAAFPELYDENGKWVFNTSICEQTNVWYGGYLPIVRDMEVTRFNFYMDEMIKRRNRYIIAQLQAKGKNPWSIPMEALFPDFFSPPSNVDTDVEML